MHTRLERSTTNKVIGGVCGGIAEYLQLDATLVRVFFVVSIFLTAGIAILGYIVLLLLMPLPGQPQPFVSSSPASAGDPSSPAATMQPVVTDPEATERRRAAFGYFLIAIGVAFLLANVGAFRIVRWDLVWPVVVVGAGVLLLAQRIRP
ncbi:MAG TPA: PspC domain-containing protein [Candidatus Limnocylindria bacterium]|nr:PspC domain-containing protein [Candidatus Limnocylindria bacterium]